MSSELNLSHMKLINSSDRHSQSPHFPTSCERPRGRRTWLYLDSRKKWAKENENADSRQTKVIRVIMF